MDGNFGAITVATSAPIDVAAVAGGACFCCLCLGWSSVSIPLEWSSKFVDH